VLVDDFQCMEGVLFVSKLDSFPEVFMIFWHRVDLSLDLGCGLHGDGGVSLGKIVIFIDRSRRKLDISLQH